MRRMTATVLAAMAGLLAAGAAGATSLKPASEPTLEQYAALSAAGTASIPSRAAPPAAERTLLRAALIEDDARLGKPMLTDAFAGRALGSAMVEAAPDVRVEAVVSIADQRMRVTVDGMPSWEWDVSTGKYVRWTPTGEFKPQWLSRNHRSSRYNNAPMPFAVFFNGHIAVHGTDQVGRLGRRASKGCVRLHPRHARKFFELVRAVGKQEVAIRVVR